MVTHRCVRTVRRTPQPVPSLMDPSTRTAVHTQVDALEGRNPPSGGGWRSVRP